VLKHPWLKEFDEKILTRGKAKAPFIPNVAK